MKIIKKFFNDKVLLIKLNKFIDNRGYFAEIYNKRNLNLLGIKENFVQDNISLSKNKFTFRGIHLQLGPYSQSKILRVIHGKIIDYVVDLRHNSKTFGDYINVQLSDKNLKCLYIPKGFGHGLLTLEKNTLISYKVSNFYSKVNSKTVIYNDKDINLNLNIFKNKNLTLSQNDKKGIFLKDLRKIYKNRIKK